MSDPLLTVAFSLGAGFLFALGSHFLSFGMRHGDPQTGTLIDIGTSALYFWLLLPFYFAWDIWLTAATAIFAAVGIFRPFLSVSFGVWGVRYLGPTLSNTVGATTPFFAVGLGVALLGEQLTLPIAAGTMVIMFGLVLLSYRGKVAVDWPLWALLLPLGAAVIRAGGNTVIKIGLDIVPSPFFAGLVTFTVGFTIALSVQRVRRAPLPDFRDRPGLFWFVASGVVHATAVTLVNAALQRGQIIVVLPLVSTYPLFSLGMSLFIFRQEALSTRMIFSILLIVPGVLLIAAL